MTGVAFSTLPREKDTYSILKLDFIVPFATPISDSTSNPRSEIRIYFTGIGATVIPRDIGYSSPNKAKNVACMSLGGLVPVSGNTISCVMYPGFSPYIEIKNFQPLAVSSSVRIELANFKNPNGDYRVTVSVLKLENEVY